VARTRRVSKTAFITGAVLLIGAMVWMLVAVPALVKYPDDLDVSPKYEGTFSVLVNPTTYAPLEEPMSMPLTVERHIEVVDAGADTAVVRETITQRAGTLVDSTQQNQYVMDRRTLKNVKDDRAWAFTPSNVVDRSGAYRLNLPFDTKSDGRYAIYKNEIGTTYSMRPGDGVSEIEREGLTLQQYRGARYDMPITDAYFAQLSKALPLPTEMTLEQMKPALKAAGLDVDALLPQLLPKLTADEVTMLTSLATTPIPLEYTMSFEGDAAIEPKTGAQVIVNDVESIGIRPDSPDLPALQALLEKYSPAVPAAASAAAALETLSSSSIKIVQYGFDQTPASITDIAGEVKDMRQQVVLATQWIPMALALLGGVALLVGAWEWPRRGRRRAAPVGVRRPAEA
jgi:hypothetical protein